MIDPQRTMRLGFARIFRTVRVPSELPTTASSLHLTASKSDRVQFRRISPVAAWIVFCSFCTGTGWILSATHQLNRVGYVIALLLGIAALVVWQRKTQVRWFALRWPRRRFRR